MGPDTVEVAAAVGRLAKAAFAAATAAEDEGERAMTVIDVVNRARLELEALD